MTRATTLRENQECANNTNELDHRDGGRSTRWTWTTPEDGNPYPHVELCGVTVGPTDTVYVYHCGAGAYHRHLFAIDSSGSLVWATDLSADAANIGGAVSALSIGQNGTLYALTSHNLLVAFDAASGAQRWSLEGMAAGHQGEGLAVGADDTLYVALPASLTAVSSSGSVLWAVDLPAPGTPSVAADGTIYVVASDGFVDGDVYALDPADGAILWQAANAGGANGLALAADGTVYGNLTSGTDSTFTALASDGRVLWGLPLNVSSAASPDIGADGTVYVTENNSLTAISGSAGLANSAWPRPSGGAQSARHYLAP